MGEDIHTLSKKKKKERKSEIVPFTTTWMDPGDIMLNKNKSDCKRQTPYDFTHVEYIKTNE